MRMGYGSLLYSFPERYGPHPEVGPSLCLSVPKRLGKATLVAGGTDSSAPVRTRSVRLCKMVAFAARGARVRCVRDVGDIASYLTPLRTGRESSYTLRSRDFRDFRDFSRVVKGPAFPISVQFGRSRNIR